MATRYRSVLSVPGSPRLLASAVLGRLPQGMVSLGVLLLVRGSSGSYATAGVAVGAYPLANALLAPVQGRLVDRFGRPRVLVPCAVGQALGLIALVIAAGVRAPAALLVVLSALAGALMPPVAPSLRALLGQVFADPEVRESAYALDSVVQEVVWTAGPLVVALVITVFSPAAAVLLTGLVCVVGTVLFVRSPAARDAAPPALVSGQRSVLADRDLRSLLGPVFLTGLALGATEIGLPAVALHAGDRGATGVLMALWSVGSMIGGLWYGARAWRSSMLSRYRALLAGAVLLSAPLIAARSIPEAIVASLLAGVTIAPVFSCQYALVGRLVSPGAETEAFTWVSGALVSGASLGLALGGALEGPGGLSAPFIFACAATLAAAVLSLRARDGAATAAVTG